jgi:peptidyl-prolyl cis-trans isomerase A (cyclophilin A)
MARLEIGSADSEFFICIGNQTQYDYGRSQPEDKQGMAAFGKVVSGMDIVRNIQNQPANGDHFAKKIVIQKIRRK